MILKSDKKCNICQSYSLSSIGKAGLKDNSVTSDARLCKGSFEVYLCSDCHHLQKVYSDENLKKIADIYSSYKAHYLSGGDEHFIFPVDGPPQPRTQYILSKCLESLPDTGKLLDLGTGTGAVLKSAGKLLKNWSLYAYDIDRKCEQYILNLPNVISFTHSTLENLPNEKFDLIVLWHTLEHISSPVDFLKRIKPLLSSKGHVLLQVPDVMRTPYDLTVIDHCSHFTQNSLSNAFLKAGYSLVLNGNSWIHNCLTSLLKPGTPNGNIGRKKALADLGHNYIEWINLNIKHFENATKDSDYVLFGNGMASVYLLGQLSHKPSAIMDEDERKSGNYVEGVQVLNPIQVTAGAKVIFPFPLDTAKTITDKLIKTYGNMGWDFILPVPFKESISTV